MNVTHIFGYVELYPPLISTRPLIRPAAKSVWKNQYPRVLITTLRYKYVTHLKVVQSSGHHFVSVGSASIQSRLRCNDLWNGSSTASRRVHLFVSVEWNWRFLGWQQGVMMLSVLDVLQKFLFLFMLNIFVEFSHLESNGLL